MEALREIQKIKGITITIRELVKFEGKKCEIIIIPIEESVNEKKLPLPRHKIGITSSLRREEIYENER